MPRKDLHIKSKGKLHSEAPAASCSIDSSGHFAVFATRTKIIFRDLTYTKGNANAARWISIRSAVVQCDVSKGGQYIAVACEDGLVTLFKKDYHGNAYGKLYSLTLREYDRSAGVAITDGDETFYIAATFFRTGERKAAAAIYKCDGTSKPGPANVYEMRSLPGKCCISHSAEAFAIARHEPLRSGADVYVVLRPRTRRESEDFQTILCDMTWMPAVGMTSSGEYLIISDAKTVRVFAQKQGRRKYDILKVILNETISPFCYVSKRGCFSVVGSGSGDILVTSDKAMYQPAKRLHGVTAAAVDSCDCDDGCSQLVITCHKDGSVQHLST